MKAAILAIGTEITSGQIVNRNPSWLSSRIESLGCEVILHMTVADEWKEMRWALDQCASKADFIFVTGGLGPTSDDFTRDVVSEWAGRKLFFHEPSLAKIKETMARLQRGFVESQNRQCYYPEGASVLVNRAGTANGFTFEARGKRLWILPGPPREVAAIWDDFISKDLQTLLPEDDHPHLFSWHCLGKPEAELAEIVEDAVKGSELKTGYRLHAPYVEVKLWCPENLVRTQTRWINKTEDAIRPWIFLRQGEDLAARFLEQVQSSRRSVHVIDFATKGHLAERLQHLLRDGKQMELTVTTAPEAAFKGAPSAQSNEITLMISPLEQERSWKTWLEGPDLHRQEAFDSSMPATAFNERNRLMAVELCLKKWSEWFQADLNC